MEIQIIHITFIIKKNHIDTFPVIIENIIIAS